MSKKTIKIKFQNGLNFEDFKKEVFEVNRVIDDFDFVDSQDPDFIVFGPYGDDVPPEGKYTRIGYFCENMTPDLNSCEFAFGIPREEEVNSDRYTRIQWHGVKPETLVKNLSDNDIDRIISEKNKFCNFIYSNKVPYREEFFKQLSKYKKVDSPGKSVNNMPSIDSLFKGNVWERKRQFLSSYKFTIAFENYAYPGYQTEKLYDAMQVSSIPIYCGDTYVQEIFNPKSFLDIRDYVKVNDNELINKIEKLSQQDFEDFRPHRFRTIKHHLSRKLKYYGRNLKMYLKYSKLDFSPLIDKIIEVDTNPESYISYLKQPWFSPHIKPNDTLSKERWSRIFNG